MRLNKVKSKNAISYYIIRSVRRGGKNSSEIVKKLGTEKSIRETYGVDDVDAWAREQLRLLNEEEAASDHRVLVPFTTNSTIDMNTQLSFNSGYLFLQQIYYKLGLPSICRAIKKGNAFEYDLNTILSRLLYGRILYPSSKLSCYEQSQKLLEQPAFELHQVYRALSVLSENSDFIQSELYKRSRKLVKRNTGILFYDCTNYFFELEKESGLKQYGPSKEHRPNPIVQMGLFMDKSGIPLAFCINPGNQNEQLSLKPLEQQIMRDFELSKFIVCTDAGLSSDANRRFNNYGERSFITTQSIKKLKSDLKEWCLDPSGWETEGSKKKYDISKLEDTPENRKRIYYKQMLIEGYDEERDIPFDQTLIVTYSLKYRDYQQTIRSRQIERARKLLDKPAQADKRSQNDAKRFIKKTPFTNDGEIASKARYEIDEAAIEEEARYDGFYAVCTNLDDSPADIAKINHDRWEIEESFRIMKSEFEARPVYLQRDDRIEAHFLTCFIALMIYRILEKELDEKFTCEEIVRTLRHMEMRKVSDQGYIPCYTRTELTDALHENAGFHTDYELTTPKVMAGIIRRTKGL
ncbi:Transposase DDE domain-containing protein [Butyrivibrio sp. ob235]|uniref:IS1634 family transposase n=1 Tax=Butyrivibrio sp. ob235 TaxID=1761780 RepID=UPI0008C47231|nr:IS1634 family transposase [Butyrivibrio sp. ob235]SEM69411.1 Transposase DDE domain-containing protein [Butyrivibrio sp. ob235]